MDEGSPERPGPCHVAGMLKVGLMPPSTLSIDAGDDDNVDKKRRVGCHWEQPIRSEMGFAHFRPRIIGGETREDRADDSAQEGDDGKKPRDLSILVLRERLYLRKAGSGGFMHAVDRVVGDFPCVQPFDERLERCIGVLFFSGRLGRWLTVRLPIRQPLMLRHSSRRASAGTLRTRALEVRMRGMFRSHSPIRAGWCGFRCNRCVSLAGSRRPSARRQSDLPVPRWRTYRST